MEYGAIPRTAVLFTLGSASLIWFAIAVALGVGGSAHVAEGLFRVLMALGATALAASLFGMAFRLCRLAEESRSMVRRLIPVPVRVRGRVRR